MSMIIQDGKGTGIVAAVTPTNRLCVDSVQITGQHSANHAGDAYNINTGIITLTSGSESAVLYFKNTDSTKIFVVNAIAVGLGPSTNGVSTEIPKITIVRNPTAGTVVSDATNVDVNSNRNFGMSTSLTADVYKGAEAKTLTDGTDHIIFYQVANGRLFAPIDEILPNGSAIGIKIDPQASNSSMTCYAALICHVEDA